MQMLQSPNPFVYQGRNPVPATVAVSLCRCELQPLDRVTE